jgi:hypothetical protein
MTNNPAWLDLAIELKKQNLAEPIFWLGDDVHLKQAKKAFGDKNIFSRQDFVFNPHDFKDIEYSCEYQNFFDSENYIRSKDICLKMMDRIDLYGTFARTDREVFFHQIVLKTLKHFFYNKPDFLLVAETPHSHAQYLIYEICLFLKIPCFKFNRWAIVPLLFLQNMETNEMIENERKINIELDKILESKIFYFLNEVKSKKEKYEIFYMKEQREQQKFFNKLINFFSFEIKEIYKDFKHNLKNFLLNKISPINPYRLNFFTRAAIKRNRANNLKKFSIKNISNFSNNKEYVFFSLHFEPERTTNPDGGRFHNQLLAIQKIRNFIPDNVEIIAKEHPSQFHIRDKGARGKSPYFYNLIKNIKGVKLIDTSAHPTNLIKNSVFVATITGTVAMEASILQKKTIVFGSTQFPYLPNVFMWSDDLIYDEFINQPIIGYEEIKKSLLNLKNKYSFVGCQTGGMMEYFKSYLSPTFLQEEKLGLFDITKKLIKKIK